MVTLSFDYSSDRHCASNLQQAEALLRPPNIPITSFPISDAMLTWLFLYNQFILTGAASALPSLPAFLQIIHF